MAIYYPDILDQRTAARTFTYGDKDVMLYALGIGLGARRAQHFQTHTCDPLS